jgi:hypothetical protein
MVSYNFSKFSFPLFHTRTLSSHSHQGDSVEIPFRHCEPFECLRARPVLETWVNSLLPPPRESLVMTL